MLQALILSKEIEFPPPCDYAAGDFFIARTLPLAALASSGLS